jgi:hypothetical protein
MHTTDAASRERNTKHIKVQNTIDVHLKTLKSLIIIAKKVSTIHTRAGKCASAHHEWTEVIESFCEQSTICETLKCGFELHMSI